MWDWTAFTVGALIGMAFILIIVIILYATNSFIFKYCNTSSNTCKNCDMENDPGVAVTEGYPISQILFQDEEMRMYHKRIAKPGKTCTLTSNQTVMMPHPQICQFTIGDELIEGKQVSLGSSIYKANYHGREITISTRAHCFDPSSKQVQVDRGVGILRWEPTPIQQKSV